MKETKQCLEGKDNCNNVHITTEIQTEEKGEGECACIALCLQFLIFVHGCLHESAMSVHLKI